MVAQECEEIRGSPGRLARVVASEEQAFPMAAPSTVFALETRNIMSADMRMSKAGSLPSALNQFTPAPLGPGNSCGKRARVVSPPNTTGSSPGTQRHVTLHCRQRTGFLSGSGPGHFLQTGSSAHSAQSMFSSGTPMAPPAALHTVNRSSLVPYTPIATSLGSLATNPPTRDITALTPPRLITPACTVQEAASPQSVAAALERMLSVTERPARTKSVPSGIPHSSVGLLQSPTTTKPHSLAAQFQHHARDSAPTPHSTPSKPSLPSQSLSALASTDDAGPKDSMLRNRGPRTTSTTTYATPTPGARSHAFAVPPLPVSSATVHTIRALLPGMHAQTAECPEMPTPDVGASADVHAQNTHSGAASVIQQSFTRQEPAGSQVHIELKEETQQPLHDEPQSPLVVHPLQAIESDECMTEDAGHTSHRILKPASESPGDEQHPCIGRSSAEAAWASTAPVMDNQAFPKYHAPALSSLETAGEACPSPGASGNPVALGLSTETLRMWNMHEAGAGATNMHLSAHGMSGCRGNRSDSMSPVLSRGHGSPHPDPISSPSQWDDEDPLSIYKHQNLVFMPSDREQALRGVPAGASDTGLLSSDAEPGPVQPAADDTPWQPWSLPQLPQGLGFAHDAGTVRGSGGSVHGGTIATLADTSTSGQVATGTASLAWIRSAPRFNSSGDASKPQS